MATPTIFSYTVADELGVKATMRAYAEFDGTVETVDGLVGEWTALGGVLDPMTGGQIVGGSVSFALVPDGAWKSAPVAGARVEQTGLFNFSNDTTAYKWGMDIPAILNTLISGHVINLAAGAVAAFIAAMDGGFTNGNFTNSAQQALVGLIDALLTFRKRRKQLTARSTEYV